MTNRKEVFRKLGIIASIFALVCTLLLTACGSTGAQPDGQLSADDAPSEEVGEAFAVYSADDNTLTFYSDAEAPEAGSDFEGKTATGVYEGIEAADYWPGWLEDGQAHEMKRVEFAGDVAPESCAFWFDSMWSCEEIVGLERLDTSNCTDFQFMFSGCKSLTSLDVSGFDTSKGTSFRAMFENCTSLTSLDVSGFDTSSGTDFLGMFSTSSGLFSNLTSLDVSGFDTSSGTDFSRMFYGGRYLSADCSAWDVSKAEDITGFNEGAPGVIPPNWKTGSSDAPSSGGFDQPKKDKPSTTPSVEKDELITDIDGKQVWKVWAAAPSLHFEGSFEGQGNFIVKVLDDNQDLEELVCNEIGDHVLDKKVPVEVGRMYYIQIECSRGSWSMTWTGTGGA